MYRNGTNAVEMLVADEMTWNQFVAAVGPGWKPPVRNGVETRVPFIANGQSWARTISAVLSKLGDKDYLHSIKIMGHGIAGNITCGTTLSYNDQNSIHEFRRLQSYCSPAVTVLHLVGCEPAAEGACKWVSIPSLGAQPVCAGPFSGNTKAPGYLLLSGLADALNAPVVASPWAQYMPDSREGWRVKGASLTVGPGGHWTYRPMGTNGQFKAQFGGP
jgi:hypothetical protein